jgi:hypothetical protein
MKRIALCVVILMALVLPVMGADAAKTLYCSPNGQDAAGRGTEAEPLKTINYAFAQIGKAGGATVVLLDGAYRQPSSSSSFEKPVTVRAKNKYKATMERLFLHRAKNLVFEGLSIDRKGGKRVVNVLHIAGWSSYITIRNCRVTHGTAGHQNTDPVKINQGAHHILVEGCEVFDGTDEEIDMVQDVHDLVFRNNIVYQLKIRDKPEALISNKGKCYRIVFEGNLLANLNPEASNGALRFGGSAKAGEECYAMLALGNMFVNTQGRGAMTFGGVKRTLVADNIFVNHNDRRTGAVTIYCNYPKGGIVNDELFVVHNLFYNVTGPRRRPVYSFPPKARAAYPKKYTFSHNLYFNPNGTKPGRGPHDLTTEQGAVFADPLFAGDPAKLKGRPASEWLAVLKLKPESPFLKSKVDLTKLKLPKDLMQFLKDYLGQGTDPWYKAIRAK